MKIRLLYVIILYSSISWSQNQANWWFFGGNAGLDFNTGTPVPNDLGQLSTTEGCAVISDACGSLLFYTDGITVWNRNHTVMPNGNGLLGDPSSTQSALVIPLPESNNLYYVFTVGDVAPIVGLNYSIVDMTLNNGLGDVIAGSKNTNLLPDSAEKIAAAVSRNGDAAWIISYTQGFNPVLFDTFYAFKLTASGIDTNATVISPMPNVQADDRRGYLRISPDGNRLAMMTQLPITPNVAGQTGRGAWLFDFNNDTGVVSNQQRLDIPLTLQVYGTEFSPDSSKLYVDANTIANGMAGDRSLFQFDLNDPTFASNPVIIYNTDPLDPADDVARGALQIAPDNKIYYTRKDTEWLSVIENPNATAGAINFINNGVQVSPNTLVDEGLPPFYNAFFNPSFTVIEGCVGNPSQFIADDIATCPNTTVLWDFGDPASMNNSSTLVDASHVYNTAGTYSITVTITTSLNTYVSTKDIVITPQPIANTATAVSICDDSSNDGIELVDFAPIFAQVLGTQNATEVQISIHNNLQDATNDFNALSSTDAVNSGRYYVRIDRPVSNGCFDITPVDITIFTLPEINPIDDIYVCDDMSNDGFEEFDFSTVTTQAQGTQSPNLFTASYYNSQADAMNGNNPITTPYTNATPTETIFIRLENNSNPNCYDTESFTINVIEQPVLPVISDLEICDDESRDLVEIFNLDDINSQITANPSFAISYHSTPQEAENGANSLPTNYETSSETIYVRLENTNVITCYDIAPVNLMVRPKPIVILPEDILKCIDEMVTISATSGFQSYLWNTGETSSSIDIIDEGIYTVTITDSNGCTDTSSITVTNYLETIITDVEIRQFTASSNSISISVTGSGPWQYSLDDFIYQDEPVFRNLLPGYYTIYVRDLNGCDTVTADATIVAAPNFFTPNGDGFNDFWQVIAIETEPDARIFIFDRFGKLLKQLSPTGIGWDGTYNGNPMPSSDYWFRVELIDGRMFRGHFSLKR